MYAASPRVDRRLLDAIDRVDDPAQPVAETYRRSRELSAELGLPRPSYESVRLHLHASRRRRERMRKKQETLLDVVLYQAPLQALHEMLGD